MVQMAAMGDLMRHNPLEQVRRRQDQSPIIANGSAGGAATPPARRIADRDRFDRYSGTLGHVGGCLAQPAPCLGPKKTLNPASKAGLHSTTAERVSHTFWTSTKASLPLQPDLSAFKRDRRAGSEWLSRLYQDKLAIDPLTLPAGPIQRHPRLHPAGEGKDQPFAYFVEPKPDCTSARMWAEFDRPGKAGNSQGLRAAGRQGAIPDRRHRPR